MGIFHSCTRIWASKPQDEEEGESRAAYPKLQNHQPSSGDSSTQLIYKALRKVYFLFSFLRPTKTADPLLPIRNPASSEPLLVPTPRICRIIRDSSTQLIYKALRKVYFLFNFLRPTKTADPLLPIRNPASSEPLLVPTPLACQPNDSSSESISENKFESLTDLGCIDDEEAECENVGRQNYSAERNEIDRKLVVSAPPEIAISIASITTSYGDEIAEEIAPENSPCVEVKETVGVHSSEEEREEEVKVQVKSVAVVDDKARKIKHYSSRHKILLVGEGDFSFSACLAVAFGSAANIIATSLNSKEFLKKHYGNALSNIAELRSRGAKVMHGIDATKLTKHKFLRQVKYDRLIFNFPHAGFSNKISSECQLRRHRRLVSLFLKKAREMISENGEIHISHKTNGFHTKFNLEIIACSHGLRLIEAVKFKNCDYPGYHTKYGFGGDGNFNCDPSRTFKFGLQTAPL